METFKKGEKIGKYVIHSFIKKGAVAESYTVLGPDDMTYFMKIFDLGTIPHEQLFQGKEVYEIQLCRELSSDESEDVIRYVDNGEVRKGESRYHYLVTEFYRGELLSDAVANEGPFDLEDAAQITLCVLNGLSYIHSRALIHNDIRPSNIMLQELDDGMLLPTIIDLGHISYMVKGRPTFYVEDLKPTTAAKASIENILHRCTPLLPDFRQIAVGNRLVGLQRQQGQDSRRREKSSQTRPCSGNRIGATP